MDIKLLQDFLSLARTKNFSRSADERNVTQPAFSRRIKQLEIWVGTDLVDRRTYPTSLTRAGKLFRESAEESLRILLAARDDLRNEKRLGRDTISFSAQHTISLWFFPKWLREIETRYGTIRTSLHADNMHNCIQSLVEGSSDFLICYHHSFTPLMLDPEAHPHKVLGKDSMVPVSAPNSAGEPLHTFPGTKQDPTKYLSYSSEVYFGDALNSVLKNVSKNMVLEKVYENAMAESLKVMAIEGHGLAWLPESCIEEALSTGRLIRLANEETDIELELRIYRSANGNRPEIDHFWNMVVESPQPELTEQR